MTIKSISVASTSVAAAPCSADVKIGSSLVKPASLDGRVLVDTAAVERWIATLCLEEPENKVLKSLTEKVQLISFGAFATALDSCIRRLPKDLTKKSVVLVEERKSNAWVAEVAFHCCAFKAERYLKLGKSSASEYTSFLDTLRTGKYPCDVLLFDDACFSGKQMTSHVAAIAAKMAEKGIKGNIYVVVPFITSVAISKFATIAPREGIDVHIFSEVIIPTVKGCISADEYRAVSRIPCFEEALPESEDSGVALTIFEHKIPNDQSFLFARNRDFLPSIRTPYTG